MVQLLKNGKVVDYGVESNINFYIHLGYEVRIVDDYESRERKAKDLVRSVWYKLPDVMRRRVSFLIKNLSICWQDKLDRMISILKTITRRAYSFTVTHRLVKEQASVIDQIKRAWSVVKSLFSPITPAAVQLAS